MANPTLLTMPLCQNADKNTIPPTDAGISGLFSEEYGWQNINSLPLASGGKAPNRRDFNGVFALLGGIAYACQRGYTFEWVATLPYLKGCVVTDPLDGNKYNAKNDVAEGGTNPSLDPTNWEIFGVVDLSGKANVTLNNLDTANLSVHVVVDSYYDSTTGNWWREYDDGWVEQGGNLGATGAYQTVNVTLLKPMADTFYYVGVIRDYGSEFEPCLGTLTPTVLQIKNFYSVNYGRWFVCGMGVSV